MSVASSIAGTTAHQQHQHRLSHLLAASQTKLAQAETKLARAEKLAKRLAAESARAAEACRQVLAVALTYADVC
jgi:division protein CdvB (Snf7/Vps24/ESCRT-III family)